MSSTSDALTEQHKQELEQTCAEWLAIGRAVEPVSRDAAANAVSAVYEHFFKLKPPTIIWCESPAQAVIMKSAVELCAQRSDWLKLFGQSGQARDERAAHGAAPTSDRANPSDPANPSNRANPGDPANPSNRANPGDPASSNDSSPNGQGDALNLINRCFDQLEMQVSAELGDRLRCVPARPPDAGRNQFWNMLPQGWFTTPIPGDLKFPALRGLGSTLLAAQSRLMPELHGVCEVRLKDNPLYSILKQQFTESFVSRGRDNLANLVLSDLNALAVSRINNVETTDLGVTELIHTSLFAAAPTLTKAAGGEKEYLRRMDAVLSLMRTSAEFYMPASTLNWLPFFKFMRDRAGDIPIGPTNLKRLTAALDLALHVHCMLPCPEVCFVTERPRVLEQDEFSRLHSAKGPAVQYTDGYRLHCWHGTRVPRNVIDNPESITVHRIELEFNAEVRRVLIERFGAERFILESGAVRVHTDEYGILYRKELIDDEPIVMVRVENSTEEPDGTRHSYFLRVPPDIKTAKAAVAWTFGMAPHEYSPQKQS